MSIILDNLTKNLMYETCTIFFMGNGVFIDWLNKEMKERGWGVRETGRRAGIAATLISNITGGDSPSFDTCVALADVFNKPRAEALILAGLLPSPPNYDPEMDELSHLFRQLESSDKKEVIAITQLKVERGKRGSGGAVRETRGNKKAG